MKDANPIDVSGSGLLKALEDARIFSVYERPDGAYEVDECCDRYFSVLLTPAQIVALASELVSLTTKAFPVGWGERDYKGV